MKLPWWMWPAWQLGRLRSDVRAAAVADAARLSELPSLFSSALLPAIAILVPAVALGLHATTVPYVQPIPNSFTFAISEVYTESLPVMAAMLGIGLIAPAAGALAVVVFAVGDLVLTVTRGELDPPIWALLARLTSYWLLWVLAVEIPVMGRIVAEWRIGDETSGAARRAGAVAVGAAVVAAMTYIWIQAAPLLIGVVFRLTRGWGGPTVAAMQALQLEGNYLLAAAAILGLLALGLRYLGGRPHLASPESSPSGLPGGPIVRYVVTVALTLVVLFGVITQPIDVVILLPVLLLARPLADFVLRSTGAGPQLARLPMPIRMILGFAVAVAIGWVVVSVLGVHSELSGFFTMVVALAVAYVVVSVFIAADSGSPAPTSAPAETHVPGGGGVATTLMLTIGLLVLLGLPAVALADNGGDHADGWAETAAAAAAAGGAGALVAGAAASRNPGPPRPLPPPDLRRARADALRQAADQQQTEREAPDKLAKERAKALKDAASSWRRRR